MWEALQIGAAIVDACCLGVVLLRGDAWSAALPAPLVLLQVIQSVLSFNMSTECTAANRMLSLVACVTAASVPTLWLLSARHSIRNELSWVMLLVDEVEEEQADMSDGDAGKPGIGSDLEENDVVQWRLERVNKLRSLLVRRQALYEKGFQPVTYGFAIPFGVYAGFLLWGFWSPSLVPLCTVRGTNGAQVWPLFQAPTASGGFVKFLMETVVPVVMMGMAGAASVAYRGEYKKGREYRIGWTVQTVLSLAAVFAFVPLHLFMGPGALSVWCSVCATSIVALAVEPELTRLIIRRLRVVQGSKGQKVLTFFDEREAANMTKETWRQMFKGGVFDLRELQQQQLSELTQHQQQKNSSCSRGCCAPPPPPA
eukprot:CAMPEP_0173405550 /NCGR_PEP_ID=MMETSP1356-20130122/62064_1 /TAXON_ID=77927 ORGANISM="Hemiselmis virescens, Strain PCC157" /NCGR_SAMPLE_ID=MMETSP1356 /ASSEMBLY_ACC=CAM_ASM_000847 /LENGTH=368 /DNA_ID=CAMNT_0014366365 /DNA_START=35 /DNA_END=1137 /DNA_ORIENTATION=-